MKKLEWHITVKTCICAHPPRPPPTMLFNACGRRVILFLMSRSTLKFGGSGGKRWPTSPDALHWTLQDTPGIKSFDGLGRTFCSLLVRGITFFTSTISVDACRNFLTMCVVSYAIHVRSCLGSSFNFARRQSTPRAAQSRPHLRRLRSSHETMPKVVKKHGRKEKAYTHVDATEARLIRRMSEEGLRWTKIRKITGRGNGAIEKALHTKPPATTTAPTVGRPKVVTPQVFKLLTKSCQALQKETGGLEEVTVAMLKAHAGVEASDRKVLEAFHENGVRFRKLKEKLILSKEDVRSRFCWGNKRLRRSKALWVKKPHATIDTKHFQLFRCRVGRDFAARRAVRGAYQKKGKKGGLVQPHLVKHKPTLNFPAKGVKVNAAVVDGRIRMWEYVNGNWNGAEAARMYKGPLLKALRKAFPHHSPTSKWCVLEDNDPSGYKSSKGLATKKEANIVTDDLPKRSPDLNVLDYSLWKTIDMRMRIQERDFPKKKETKTEFMARLRHTALTLPTAVVQKAVRDMHRRVRLVVKFKGRQHIE